MFRDALNFPSSGERGAASLVIGGLLTLVLAVADLAVLGLLALVVAPETAPESAPDPGTVATASRLLAGALAVDVGVRLLLRGYYVGALRAVAGSADPEAPSFRGWRRPLDGVASVLVFVAYLLPAAGLLVAGVSLGRVVSMGLAAEAVALLEALALLFGLFALVAAAYLIPAAATLFAHGSLRDAFALRRLVGGALSEDYAVAWLESVLVYLVLWPLAFLLQVLLVGVFLRFYLNVTVRYLHARGLSDAMGLTGTPERDLPPTPAQRVTALEDTRERRATVRGALVGRRGLPDGDDLDREVADDDPVAEEFTRR